MNEINCSNCQTKILSAYCPQCGQKYVQKRVNFFTIFTDFGAQILSLEQSVFATMLKIITSPKTVIENYWNGYRNYDQSPGKLLFYFLTELSYRNYCFISHFILLCCTRLFYRR